MNDEPAKGEMPLSQHWQRLLEENIALHTQLEQMQATRVWRLAQRYWAWRDAWRRRFRDAWHLYTAPPVPQSESLQSAPLVAQRIRQKHLLVLLTAAPRPEHWGSQRREMNFIRMALALGWQVSVWLEKPELNQASDLERLQHLGIKLMTESKLALQRILQESPFAACLASSWLLAEALLPSLQTAQIALLVDVKDLEFVRDLRYHSLHPPHQLSAEEAQRYQREWNVFFQAQGLLCVSPSERAFLQSVVPAHLLCAHIADSVDFPTPVAWEQREGMVFVGNYHYPPNLDALQYLIEAVLPLIPLEMRAQHPLRVIGDGLPTECVIAWSALPYVEILGWVASASEWVARARLALVPIRYGTGVKNKIIGALAAGTPVVTTPIGAEGLDPTLMCVAETPQALASSAELLLKDAEAWHRLAQAGLAYTEQTHRLETIQAQFGDVLRRVTSLE